MCTAESHARAKSDSQWPSLHFLGLQADYDDNGNYAPLALANTRCCGTTLARTATALDFELEAARVAGSEECGSTLARPVEQARVEGVP
jgi:hypothetical protein